MTCFQNTYKYFRILRTKNGPIFFKIFLDAPEKLASPYKYKDTVNNVLENSTNNHPRVSRQDTTVISASDVEEKLQKTSTTVSVQAAQEMFSCFDSTKLHYEFHGQNFIGNQVYITSVVISRRSVEFAYFIS
jgi:hypothetical protein